MNINTGWWCYKLRSHLFIYCVDGGSDDGNVGGVGTNIFIIVRIIIISAENSYD